jgi:hypothetical protein
MRRLALPLSLILLCAAPLAAKDSLGVFGQWGSFRDPTGPRCYAISAGETGTARREFQPFASVGTWPTRQVRGQLHIRPSRNLGAETAATLRIGGASFRLSGGASDLWAADPGVNAAILAAMRSAASMQVSGRDARGNRFTDRYSLEGVATAMDAASIACARR